jgi:hypothetical protein
VLGRASIKEFVTGIGFDCILRSRKVKLTSKARKLVMVKVLRDHFRIRKDIRITHDKHIAFFVPKNEGESNS